MSKNPDRVDVSSVSPLVLVVALAVALIALALLPKARRFHIVLTFTVAWSMVGQMLDLPIYAIAKASFVICLLSLVLAALLHPGPRLRMSPTVLWWLVLACFAILFVLYVDNLLFALILRFQWIVMCTAAILTARLMVDRQAADAIARAIAVGLMIGIAIALTSIYRTGASAFHIGRFSPYGANANQVGVLFAAAVPFSLYCAMRARRQLTRWTSVGMAAVALGMVVMTASRTSVVVTGICLLPFFFSGMRRSTAIVGAVVVGAIVVIPFAYTPDLKPAQEKSEGYGMGRLDSLETGRIEIFARYLDEAVSKRPITGLLGEEERSVLRDEDIGAYSHNVYLEMMYVGGILYTLPMLLLAFATIVAAVRVVLARKRLPFDPLLTAILGSFVFAIYIHGMVGSNAYYPTSGWGLLHVFISSFVLSAAAALTRDARVRRKRARPQVPVAFPATS